MFSRCLSIITLFFVLPFGVYPMKDIELSYSVETYDYEFYNQLVNRFEINADNPVSYLRTRTGYWKIVADKDQKDTYTDYTISYLLIDGNEMSANVGVRISFDNWDEKNYVLLPSSAYNGNRFEWRKIAYSPKLLDPRDIKKDGEMIISDVPRLTKGKGVSRIQERSGSMAVPSFLFFSSKLNRSFVLLTKQSNQWGDYGYTLEENRMRDQAVFSLRSPLIRENFKYNIANNMDVSSDKPADFKKGDEVEFRFRIYDFESKYLSDLFEKYMIIRHDLVSPSYNAIYPFSECFATIEEKFNTQNFVPEWGYYSVGMREMFLQDWQIGWTGGMISTYPLLFAGTKKTEANVLRNFDWLFEGGISPSGFFWDCGENGNQWYGGDIRKPHTKNWHLIRKSGDGLYYILKQFTLMELKEIEVKESWKAKVKGVADAFVRLWNKNHQWGQFIDNETGEIKVGGSTSGAIVPAALALASIYYDQPEYMQVAEASARYMYERYVKQGITCGGPGDALQNCDSESAYALLESFSLLYEHTRSDYWKQAACDMAHLFSTWVVGYDYKFPRGSLFHKLDMHSTGAVVANTQNKHGSPGICTHSGIALLRLYRFTGNELYLNLLKEIAFNLPQYMSHKDRRISGMAPGWVNERISTTDWFEGIGEIFPGSTWAETALMLTAVEIPGIYVDLPKQLAISFDNVEVNFVRKKGKGAIIQIKNPTAYDANISILVDGENRGEKMLGEHILFGAPYYTVEANQQIELYVDNHNFQRRFDHNFK